MSGVIDCWNRIGVQGAATCERLAAVAHCRNCPDYIAAGRVLLDRDVPEAAPEEWARAIAEPKQSRRSGSLSTVVFRIGAEWLALKTIAFEQAVTARPIHSVPLRTNHVFLGLVNVEGELLLCFSLGDALGLGQDPSSGSSARGRKRLLVVNRDGQRFAFPVDEVLGVRSLAPDDFAPAPATLSKAPDAISVSVFSIGARRIALLDEARFFDRLMRALAS